MSKTITDFFKMKVLTWLPSLNFLIYQYLQFFLNFHLKFKKEIIKKKTTTVIWFSLLKFIMWNDYLKMYGTWKQNYKLVIFSFLIWTERLPKKKKKKNPNKKCTKLISQKLILLVHKWDWSFYPVNKKKNNKTLSLLSFKNFRKYPLTSLIFEWTVNYYFVLL